MKRGKEQRVQKNQQKQALRRARRAATRVTPKPSALSPKKQMVDQKTEMGRVFQDPVYLRWLANGVNYLLSDYERGHWNPLFESLDQAAEMPSPEEIARRVLLHFGNPTSGTYEELLLRVCISWTMLIRETHYLYYRETLRRLAGKTQGVGLEPTPNATAWKLVHEFKQHMLVALPI